MQPESLAARCEARACELKGVKYTAGRAAITQRPNASIAVLGGELPANPARGLGRVIFGAEEFLNPDIMMASLITIFKRSWGSPICAVI
jgi:hypothetical protein